VKSHADATIADLHRTCEKTVTHANGRTSTKSATHKWVSDWYSDPYFCAITVTTW